MERIDDPALKDMCEDLEMEYEQLMKDRDNLRKNILPHGEDGIYMPVNVDRLLWTAKEMTAKDRLGRANREKTDLTPDYVIAATK